MESLQKEYDQLLQKEIDLLSNHNILKLEKIFKYVENVGCLFFFPVFIFYSFLTIKLLSHNYVKVIYSYIIENDLLAFIFFFFLLCTPVFLLMGITLITNYTLIFLNSILEIIFFFIYGTNKDEYNNIINLKSNLYERKRKLLNEINIANRKSREIEFVLEINDFINKLTYNEFNLTILSDKLESLEFQKKLIEQEGYLVNQHYFYYSKFKLIKSLIEKNNKLINEKQVKNNDEKQVKKNEGVIVVDEIKSSIITDDKINNDGLITDINTSESDLYLIENEIIEFKKNKENSKLNQKKLPKIDYQEQLEKRQKIGRLGELFAIEWEKTKLIRDGLSHLTVNLEHVSLSDDSRGYDFVSFNQDGSKKYIEVKTTTGDFKTSFYLTETEINALNNLENYYIYRVFNFNTELNTGNLFVINCKNDIQKYYSLKPISFLVTPI